MSLSFVTTLIVLLFTTYVANAVEIGDEVFCIERGTLLDPGGGIVSLEEPQRHTFHCLFDVGICIDSGYTVLGPKDDTGLHCIGYRIEDTDAVVEAGRALGKAGSYPLCDTCANTDKNGPLDNYKATVKGVVSELGDGTAGEPTGAPLISNVQMLDASVGCDGEETLAPLCSTHNWDADILSVADSSAQANQFSSTKANQSSSFICNMWSITNQYEMSSSVLLLCLTRV